MILLGIFAVVTALMHSWAGLPLWWSVTVAVIVTAVYYRRDVRRRPRVPCRICAGGGASQSRLGGTYFRRPFGDCWCCGGTKAHARMALRLIDPARYRTIRDEIRSERTMI